VLAAAFWQMQKKGRQGRPVVTSQAVVARPNVILITIDTLRPDHLGAYGYPAAKTPVIDRLASTGVLFKEAVCQTPLTLVSHSSIFTGLNPNVHGVRDNAYFILADRFTTLPEYLKREGYRTAAFIGSAILDRQYGLAQGFDYYSHYQPTAIVGMESQRRGDEVTSEALNWLKRSEQQSAHSPYFLWIHLYDPHMPYEPPDHFRTEFPDSPYDGEIAYTDSVLSAFYDQIKQMRVLDNSLTIVMGDHGESLGQHREEDHGFYIYDATLRIPLILNWPGHLPAGKIVEQQVQSIDVLPTVADLVGFHTDGSVQGRSLAGLMKGQAAAPRYAYGEILTSKLYYGWSELRSVRENEWKYIQAPESELYNLKEDPGETRNLAPERPDKVRLLREQLRKFLAMEQRPENEKAKSVDAERIEQLASLGYVGAVNPGSMLNAASNIDPKTKIDDYRLLHKVVPEAIAWIDKGEYQTGLNELQRVQKRFANSFVLYWYMGLCQAKLGALAKAQEEYAHAIRLNPFFGRAYTDLALTLELNGKSDEAVRLLDTIPVSAVSVSDREYTRGEIKLHQGKLDEAESAYLAARQSDAQNLEPRMGLARVYMAGGRIENAVKEMQALADARYPSEDVYYSLSAIYGKEGMKDQARKTVEQWIALFPRSTRARAALDALP
jgi:arylsulfatase A-like enzyme/Flp pilus assembly protein TadD